METRDDHRWAQEVVAAVRPELRRAAAFQRLLLRCAAVFAIVLTVAAATGSSTTGLLRLTSTLGIGAAVVVALWAAGGGVHAALTAVHDRFVRDLASEAARAGRGFAYLLAAAASPLHTRWWSPRLVFTLTRSLAGHRERRRLVVSIRWSGRPAPTGVQLPATTSAPRHADVPSAPRHTEHRGEITTPIRHPGGSARVDAARRAVAMSHAASRASNRRWLTTSDQVRAAGSHADTGTG